MPVADRPLAAGAAQAGLLGGRQARGDVLKQRVELRPVQTGQRPEDGGLETQAVIACNHGASVRDLSLIVQQVY